MRPKEDQWQDVVARAYGRPLPISFTYQVTEDCTLACTYCYQNNKSPKRMSWDIAKRATDYADVIIGISPGSLDPQGFRRLNPKSHCPCAG